MLERAQGKTACITYVFITDPRILLLFFVVIFAKMQLLVRKNKIRLCSHCIWSYRYMSGGFHNVYLRFMPAHIVAYIAHRFVYKNKILPQNILFCRMHLHRKASVHLYSTKNVYQHIPPQRRLKESSFGLHWVNGAYGYIQRKHQELFRCISQTCSHSVMWTESNLLMMIIDNDHYCTWWTFSDA